MFLRRIFFTAALFFGMFLYSVLPAAAFTIQPIRYRVSLDPGSSTELSLSILNDEATSHHFRVSVEGVTQDEHGRPVFGSSLDVVEEWVKSDKTTFSLQPGQKQLVTFTVSAPKDAEPGSHFLALIVEPVDSGAGEVGVSTRSAALVSLTVSGMVNEMVSIDQFASPALLSTAALWPIQATLKNRGTVSVKLEGTVIVKNALGQIISGQSVSLRNTLLPKANRLVNSKIVLDHAKAWLPGWYTVNLAIHYGLSKKLVERQSIVWYFPPWSIITGGVCLTGILFFIFLKLHHSKK